MAASLADDPHRERDSRGAVCVLVFLLCSARHERTREPPRGEAIAGDVSSEQVLPGHQPPAARLRSEDQAARWRARSCTDPGIYQQLSGEPGRNRVLRPAAQEASRGTRLRVAIA